MAGVVAAGIGTGGMLSNHISSQAARNVAIALAGLGGAAAVTRGILSLA